MNIPSPLPPGVRVEEVTYANGKTDKIYYAPYESDGPVVRIEGDSRILYYEYAAYVFRWPEGTTQVDISHGTIKGDQMCIWEGVLISGRWHPDTLAAFGQQWAKAEIGRWSR